MTYSSIKFGPLHYRLAGDKVIEVCSFMLSFRHVSQSIALAALASAFSYHSTLSIAFHSGVFGGAGTLEGVGFTMNVKVSTLCTRYILQLERD